MSSGKMAAILSRGRWVNSLQELMITLYSNIQQAAPLYCQMIIITFIKNNLQRSDTELATNNIPLAHTGELWCPLYVFRDNWLCSYVMQR